MRNDKPNLIVELTFTFSLSIIEYCNQLDRMKKFYMAKQLFRSGTSIGANVREAQNSESPNDFIHKMKIAAKEADETYYWLELCDKASGYPAVNGMKNSIMDIIKITSKIISTSKKKYSR